MRRNYFNECAPKPSMSILDVFKVLLHPVIGMMGGFGMFMWYQQPFGIKLPLSADVMIACYCAALGGYFMGMVNHERS